jgi:predicted RNA methylase
MFGTDLSRYLIHTSAELDLVGRITQHPERPKPLRKYDQIFMLPGSQLSQAKLISDYVYGRSVAFVGDGDCMSLVLAYLGEKKIIAQLKHIVVFDFDKRILRFIEKTAHELGVPRDLIETVPYNVRYPIPSTYKARADVFYTNPPYGSADRGECAKLFLGRCMEFCKPVGSWGIAILPYEHDTPWSRNAMANIQKFLVGAGYVVSEMIRGIHRYHLENRPDLFSGAIVVDRVDEVPAPYAGQTFSQDQLKNCYGSEPLQMPDYIEENGHETFPFPEEPSGQETLRKPSRRHYNRAGRTLAPTPARTGLTKKL